MYTRLVPPPYVHNNFSGQLIDSKRVSRLCCAVFVAMSFIPQIHAADIDYGIIDGPFFFQNKDNYDQEAYYLLKPSDGKIEGDCLPGDNRYDTPLSIFYSKLNAYLDSNVTIYDKKATIHINSNVEHDAKLNLKGLNDNTSLTLISEGIDSVNDLISDEDRVAFANIYLSGTEEHSASLTVSDLTLNLVMEDVLGKYGNGTVPFGGGVIATGLNTDYTNAPRNVQVSFDNSTVNILLDVSKYSKKSGTLGFAAGILMAGYERYNDGTTSLNVNDSALTIDSDLQGIFLQNANLNLNGSSDLTVRAGLGLGEQGITLSSTNSSAGTGLYLSASLSTNFSSYAKESQFSIKGNFIDISGFNGIEVVRYTEGDYITAAPTRLSLDNVSAKIVAIDSHGHFQNTAALSASVNKDVDSNIGLAGSILFSNHQSASSDIEENFYSDTYIHGIHLEKFDLKTFDSSKVNTSIIIDVSSKGLEKTPHVYGIEATDSNLTFNHALDINVLGQTKGTTIGVALDGSDFTSSSALNIRATKEDQTLGTAFDISGDSTVNINNEGTIVGADHLSYIIGDINVVDGSFNLNRSDAFEMVGAITTAESDTNNSSLTFSNTKSAWYVSGDSTVNSLTLEDGALLSFDLNNKFKSLDTAAYHSLTTASLSLNDASLQLKVDVGADQTDVIYADSVNGTATVYINPIGELTEHKDMANGFLYQNSGDLTLQLADKNGDGKPDQVVYQNGSLLGYKLAYKNTEGSTAKVPEETPEGYGDFSDTEVTGSGEGYWYLARGDEGEIPQLPGEVAQILSLGSSSAQAISWMAEKEDLRHRLGEIRYGVEAGAWAKVFDKQNRVTDGYGFKQETSGIHIGVDGVVSKSDSGQWLLGGALRYAKADQEGLLEGNGSSGDLKEYSAKFYATYMANSGSYLDLVTQIGYYDQEINGRANDYLTRMKASYDTIGVGVSAEVGHHFKYDSTNGDSWFIEPSGELSYFYVKGKELKTSTNIRVDQDNADFLTARAGVSAGRTIVYGMGNQNYVQFSLDAGMYYEFLADQDIRFTDATNYSMSAKAADIGGWTTYYGAGINWKMSDRTRLYGQISREEGDNYTQDYSVSVGVKYAF